MINSVIGFFFNLVVTEGHVDRRLSIQRRYVFQMIFHNPFKLSVAGNLRTPVVDLSLMKMAKSSRSNTGHPW
ncbi:hypothetical protein CEP52_005543 [Fusarium oligoseptatum]|uniref:Uncharacterized protein n=1 Tax=Fusarium oligoseptatum TaxID=2604345 RepID=A0A428TXI3_9HYPO|nr:hypothetical protein CEP52_005543 [Fusarium oligoseptatum]